MKIIMVFQSIKKYSFSLKLNLSGPKSLTGFTLIEFIIYIGIVAAILLVYSNFGWEVIYGNVKSQALREVQQNSRFVIEKMSESILAASGINNPDPGDSGNSLSLEMQDSSLNPTIFDVLNGKLRIAQASAGGPYELTSSRVKVTNLQFTNLSYPESPGIIRVQITIEHVNPNNLSQYRASISAETSVSLRK